MDDCDHLGVEFPGGRIRGCKCLKPCCYKWTGAGTLKRGRCVCSSCTCGAKYTYPVRRECAEDGCTRSANGGMVRCAPCNKAKLDRLHNREPGTGCATPGCKDDAWPGRKKCRRHLDQFAAQARRYYQRKTA